MKLCVCLRLGNHLDCQYLGFRFLKGTEEKLAYKTCNWEKNCIPHLAHHLENNSHTLLQEEASIRLVLQTWLPKNSLLFFSLIPPLPNLKYLQLLHFFTFLARLTFLLLLYVVQYPRGQHYRLRYLNMTLRNESVLDIKAYSHHDEHDCNV